MPAPVAASIITGSGGPTAHNNCIATGTFKIDTAVTTPLWIHLGFVPKLFFLGNSSDATGGGLFVWWEHCPSRYCKRVDTSTLTVLGNGVTPLPGHNAASLVTAADIYLKENVAVVSTETDPDDRVIGVMIEGDLCGQAADDELYYCALR